MNACVCACHPQRAEEEIPVVAGYSMKTAALTGPPRPCVYCLRKCFGGQKPGTALKDGSNPTEADRPRGKQRMMRTR